MNVQKAKSQKVKQTTETPIIGFIGQGFVGKSYADDFEARGFSIVRYALEVPYRENKEKIKTCDIVFIAVPTPTIENKFDYSIIESALTLVGNGKIAVIKSTILPGTTELLQKQYKDIFLMHSPEFLTEANASYDAGHPERNIIGIPVQNSTYQEKAQLVLSVLPHTSFEKIMGAKEAELVKYGGNCFLYMKVIFGNLMYEAANELGISYDAVRDAMAADPRIGKSHLNPVHHSGRGAGGHCFIKDFAAFAELYKSVVGDVYGGAVLDSLRDKNNNLLLDSHKDIDLLTGVYGADFLKKYKK